MKQSSDHMQKAGASGTKLTKLSGTISKSASIKPAGVKPSGSSQSDSRGKQGRG